MRQQPQERRTNEVNNYQSWTDTTASPIARGESAAADDVDATALGVAYCTLGLIGEAAEYADAISVIGVAQGASATDDERIALTDELGDVLWYATRLTTLIDMTLEQVMDYPTFGALENYVRGDLANEVARRLAGEDIQEWELDGTAAVLVRECSLLGNTVKKVIAHGYTLEEARDSIEEALEAIMYAITLSAITLNVQLQQVVDANMFKLEERHPHGFRYRQTAL